MVYSLLERRNGHMKEWNKDTYQSIRERKIRAHKVCNRERERERERERGTSEFWSYLQSLWLELSVLGIGRYFITFFLIYLYFLLISKRYPLFL
jgi:hypothetical protein